jgi:hypothetical protein
MNGNKENLNAFFQQTKGISEQRARFYGGWLNRFLQFHNGGSEAISEDALIGKPVHDRKGELCEAIYNYLDLSNKQIYLREKEDFGRQEMIIQHTFT